MSFGQEKPEFGELFMSVSRLDDMRNECLYFSQAPCVPVDPPEFPAKNFANNKEM